jgi:hypothetical protein
MSLAAVCYRRSSPEHEHAFAHQAASLPFFLLCRNTAREMLD